MNDSEILWEEKNSTEQKRNFLNKEIIVQRNGISETKKESAKTVCEDTGKKKIWKRNCPTCNEEIVYNYKANKISADKHNRLCLSCLWKSQRTHHTPDILERNCPKCGKILKYNKSKYLTNNRHNYINAVKNNTICKKCHAKYTNPMKGIQRLGKANPNYGNKWNDKQKETARLREIENIKRKGITGKSINYNPKACEYFNELNKEKGWNLQHRLNGGEIIVSGYFLDAYDNQRNIVVEYDENYHSRPHQIKKDLYRTNIIKNHLQCQFYRYNEETKQLIKY